MDNIKISLAIFGNQNSNSGFQPLYWINDPPQELENIVPPGMDENPYFFTLQVLPAHTQFTLIHNRVSSYMSARPGVLKMAVTIPKGYAISSGVSPMQVLLDVRRTFIDTCMTLRDAHAEAYNFKEKLADPSVFASIIDAYRLEPVAMPHLPMTGTDDAAMLLDDAAIAQLFADPQHPEFQSFRRIIIANKGKTSVYKTLLNAAMLTTAAGTNSSDDGTKATLTNNTTDDSMDGPATVASTPTANKGLTSKNKKRLAALLCSLFVIAGATFLLWPSAEKKTVSYEDDAEEMEAEIEEISAAEKQLARSIRADQQLLADSMLTFDDIILLTQRMGDSIATDDISAATLAKYDDLRRQVMVYDTLRLMCSRQEYKGTWKYIKEQKALFSTALDSLYATGYLNPIHYHYLQAAYMVPKPCPDSISCIGNIDWAEDNREKLEVFKKFLQIRDHNNPYKSFRDVFDLALGRSLASRTEEPAAIEARPADEHAQPSTPDYKQNQNHTWK